MSEQDDFMGAGDSLKFESVGDSHSGVILSISSQQDRDPGGKGKTWEDGSPKKVYLWQVDTVDGPAVVWVRGNLVNVLRDAARKAGAKRQADLIGSRVQIKHHALGEATQKGFSPPKLFQAKITLADPAEKEYDPFDEV